MKFVSALAGVATLPGDLAYDTELPYPGTKIFLLGKWKVLFRDLLKPGQLLATITATQCW